MMGKNVSLNDREKYRVISCLFNEACRHSEISEEYKKRNLRGIAASEWGDSLALMKIREKFKDSIKKE